MTTEYAGASDSTKDTTQLSNLESATPDRDDKRFVTPAERWMLICENVYARAQQRGFVGGNPLQDLADAEQEIDATYETDFCCVFSLTSTAEITEQLKSLFAGYGFDKEDLDNLLDGHQEGLERLAAMNRDLLDSASAVVVKQTQLLEGVASEAAQTIRSVAQGQLGPEGVFSIAELSMQAFGNSLMRFQGSAESAPNVAEDRLEDTSSSVLLQGAVASDFQGKSASQLMDVPVTALKGVSSSLGKQLEERFEIRTIREMAANKHAEWARAVVLLAKAGSVEDHSSRASLNSSSGQAEECNDLHAVVNSPIIEVRDSGDGQAGLFKEEFGIETVYDLGTHPLFDVARAIAMLAESED